jgi:primosomal protein N' (replication factor Y)
MRDLFIAAKAATKDLKAILSETVIVLGPALPIVSRIKNRYLCQVLIKYKEEPELNRALQTLVEHYTSDLIDLAIDRNPSLG